MARRLVEEIEKEGAQMRKDAKVRSLGVKKILRMQPHHRPGFVVKSPKPKVHAIDRDRRSVSGDIEFVIPSP